METSTSLFIDPSPSYELQILMEETEEQTVINLRAKETVCALQQGEFVLVSCSCLLCSRFRLAFTVNWEVC